ncbi:homocysteine S-methyltransferase family protein [Alkalibacter rhizosphaerae]|uniref:Methionine synthase n=1 Tax=Alkalibacter rhizosphaerae TaxID=2815577 RepID=A0A974XDU8_9FIRM|nr:homocysteine S-methyltransferase family protein [Alkalibacter rhizosphaerae]QSX08008.1 homocysteine S-methyltransferase family protein [Alkalibacter rhizosphaerae]
MKPWDKDGFIFFDGGMGTQLQKRIPERILPEEANIRYPEILEEIQREYVKAGADIITTNTFGANPYKLGKVGLDLETVVEAAVSIARRAAPDRLVALDIGPLGRMMEPTGEMTFEEAYDAFRRQVVAGAGAGCDLILIETMSDLQEARCAVLAAKENSDLPVFCTMTFDEKGHTLTGTDPRTMVAVLEGLGVDVLGVNCSLGPDKLLPIVKEVLDNASIPVMVQPNAGMPVYRDGQTHYDISKEHFAENLAIMADMGATILGGCCGTDASYIEKVREAVTGKAPVQRKEKAHTLICSYRKSFSMDEQVTIVSENVLPHGNKTLMEAFIREDYRKIVSKVRGAKNKGAHLVDLRTAGLPGKDETLLMVETIKNIQKSLDVPLMLESRNPQTLEAALRTYNGKAVVNGLDGSRKTMETLFPVVKKYGAAVVALTLDEDGPARTWQKRLSIAEKILKTAKKFELSPRDVIIDPMVLPVANGADAMDTIRAAAAIKEELGLKVLLGIGNVSFKMPERGLLDRTYLAMALSWGVDALLLNVEQEEMMQTIQAGLVLTGRDPGGSQYVLAAGSVPEARADLDEVANSIYQGQCKEEAVGRKNSVLEGLLAAEEAYAAGEILLPNLARSVAAAENSMKDENGEKGIILFTGDLKKPGLALAKTIARILGFQVVEPSEVILLQPVRCVVLEVPFGITEERLKTWMEPWVHSHPDAALVLMGPGGDRVGWKSLGIFGAVTRAGDWINLLEAL